MVKRWLRTVSTQVFALGEILAVLLKNSEEKARRDSCDQRGESLQKFLTCLFEHAQCFLQIFDALFAIYNITLSKEDLSSSRFLIPAETTRKVKITIWNHCSKEKLNYDYVLLTSAGSWQFLCLSHGGGKGLCIEAPEVCVTSTVSCRQSFIFQGAVCPTCPETLNTITSNSNNSPVWTHFSWSDNPKFFKPRRIAGSTSAVACLLNMCNTSSQLQDKVVFSSN